MLGIDKRREGRRHKGFRLPDSQVAYVEREGKKLGHGGDTAVVEDCISKRMMLDEVLSANKQRFERYATDNDLSLRDNATLIIKRLLLAGLEAHETKARK